MDFVGVNRELFGGDKVKKIYFYYIWGPLIVIALMSSIAVIKVKAEIAMCKTYYSEMSTWDCYWAPKFLPQRN